MWLLWFSCTVRYASVSTCHMPELSRIPPTSLPMLPACAGKFYGFRTVNGEHLDNVTLSWTNPMQPLAPSTPGRYGFVFGDLFWSNIWINE